MEELWLSRLLIEGATVITLDGDNHIYSPGDIICEGNCLIYVGPSKPWQHDKFHQIVSGKSKVVIPGLVNTHTHAAMTLFRSYADDLALHPWLKEKIWPLEAKLTPEAVYWGSLLACLEMMEAGVTTFADMYFFMEQTARAVTESGLRADLSVGMAGVDAKAGQKALEQGSLFVQEYQGMAEGRINCRLGPHAPYTCPQPFIIKVLETAQEINCGIHIHLAETKLEVAELVKETGLTPIEFYHEALQKVGMVPSLAAHCVHVNDRDIDILAQDKIGVAHNPGSNLKLASGFAPLQALLHRGVSVGLGTDGAASNNNLDILEEARLAALIHKCTSGDPTAISANQALRLATIEGAKVLGMDDQIGSLEVGKQADLVLLNEDSPHLYPKHDIVSRLIYSARASDVDMVLVAGKIVVQDGIAVTINRQEIMRQAQRIVEEIW